MKHKSPLFVTLKDIHAHEGPDLLSQSILTVSGRHETKSQFISAVCLAVSCQSISVLNSLGVTRAAVPPSDSCRNNEGGRAALLCMPKT